MHTCKNPSFVCSGVDFFLSIYHITRCKLFYATDTAIYVSRHKFKKKDTKSIYGKIILKHDMNKI